MISIFSLPEIAVSISYYLEEKDLYSCVLVHSSWFHSFTPCLWRTVNSLRISDKRISEDNIIESAFIKNNRHIRTLYIGNESPSVSAVALKHCSHLSHISVPSGLVNIYTKKFVGEILIPAIRRNQGLKTLVFKSFPRHSMFGEDYSQFFKTAFEPLRSLTTLHLSCINIDHKAFLYIVKFAKQLHRFYLNFDMVRNDAKTDYQDPVEIPDMEQTQLKELGLASATYQESLLITFLKASPMLEKLSMPKFKSESTKAITTIMRRYCPKLRDVDIGRTQNHLTDDDVTDLIHSCSVSKGLRSFRTHERVGFGPQAMDRLCANSATLECIIIPAIGQEGLKIVQRLLTSCPNLRKFDVSEDFLAISPVPSLLIGELLKEPWVCVKLEVLNIPLAGVCTGVAEGENGNDGQDYHRDLYTQLSKLRRLQELDSSFSIFDNAVCDTPPLFSLESGLDLLEGLKEMRILNLEYANDVGREELEWMVEHWPNLERVVGIEFDDVELWWSTESRGSNRENIPIPKRIRSILESFYVYNTGSERFRFGMYW